MAAIAFFSLSLFLSVLHDAAPVLGFTRGDFPQDFVFGAASSAYQYEGAVAEDGRSPSIWDTFTHAGKVPDKSTGDIAADGYHKYKDDVKLMTDTNLEAYRFSISWSRLIPSGRGAVNQKGLEYYNNLIDELVKRGIQVHVMLYQLDLPQVLDDEYGGWLRANSSPEEGRSSPEEAMGSPHPARVGINIEACARPITVDHRISLPYYFRIAGTLLRQAEIYRDEKNLLDLYVILLRYSSLLCETIPKHRGYHAFKSRETEFFKNAPHNSSKLIDVLNELESLKPVVQRQISEHNRGVTAESNSLNGTYAASHRTEQHTTTTYSPQPFVGSNNGSLQKIFHGGRHQVASLQSVQPNRQISKRFVNLPFPKEETLARHSILGPNGLHGQWTGPVAGIKVQYPSNLELMQSDITSLVPAILNQDGLHGTSIASLDSTKNDNEDMKSVLSLDDGRWSAPAEECTSVPSVSLEEELPQLNIRQPSPPPVLAEVHPERRPISPSSIADPTPGLAISETGRYQNLHVPVKLMECFLRVAEANTKRSLETCGVLAGTLKKRTFYVTTLIIPKQKSTSDSCEATNEEELFEVQDVCSLFTLGWIHTHPTQSCFLSSIDLHNHYSYQVMLPEAIAIVMAPTDTRKTHGIFHLTDPGGMGVIHDCPERGFHPHKAPLDGSPIYEHCSHVYMNPDIKFDMIDLRER